MVGILFPTYVETDLPSNDRVLNLCFYIGNMNCNLCHHEWGEHLWVANVLGCNECLGKCKEPTLTIQER